MKSTDYFRSLKHDVLLDAIKDAATCDAKIDALGDFVYKIVVNDLHALEERVSKNEAFRWRVGGIVAAATAIVQVVIHYILR